jgi:hypothetical protein
MELKEVEKRIYRLEDALTKLVTTLSDVEDAEGIDDKYDAMKKYIKDLGEIEELLNDDNTINYYG